MAEFKLMSDLVTDVQRELSQVPGIGTQAYSEDYIVQLLTAGFKVVFREEFWPHLSEWFQKTLDGSTGQWSGAGVDVYVLQDVRCVYGPKDRYRPLPHLPRHINPYEIAGTTPRYVEGRNGASTGKPFRIWPLAATGTITFQARVMPDDEVFLSSSSDEVPFDDLTLVYYAAWQYIENDGSNPGQAEKLKNMFEARLAQEKKNLANLPIDLDPRMAQSNSEWVELP